MATIDPKLFLDCVHCGLCTSACPTYLETGNENDNPRGRIHLMRAVTEGRLPLDDHVRRHLDLCLDCRACESACPSGVQYGRLIEPFRVQLGQQAPGRPKFSWLARSLIFGIAANARRMRLALAPVRWMQRLHLDWMLDAFSRLLPKPLQQAQAMLPRLQPNPGRLPEVLPAEGPRRARVALFTGCAADAFFPDTTWATARVLQKNGCDVLTPRTQVCCGALYYHSAQEEPAKLLGLHNVEAFATALKDVDAVIVNAAGCGAMLKNYTHLFGDDHCRDFVAKVADIHEFLMRLGPVPPTHPLPLKAVYHDACHLCHGQQIRQQPRQLLAMIPELQLLPLAESEICCGAAGSYNLTEPEMAQQLGQRKTRHIIAAGVDAVFTGNVGCILQVARHLRPLQPALWVAHPVDALWASYSGSHRRHERQKH